MSEKNLVEAAKKQNGFAKFMSNEIAYLLIGLVIYIVIISIIAPNFATAYNVANLTEQLSIPIILAIGMAMVMIAGGIDLSIGNQVSFICCLMAGLMYDNTMQGMILALILGPLVCIGMSTLMGLLISRSKMEPFIVSVAFMTIYKGLAYISTSGAEFPINGQFGWATEVRFLTLPLMVYIMIAIVIIFFLIFKYSRFGRWLFAVGDNPNASFLSGINVKNFKLKTYVINGVLVALASVLMLSRTEVGNPTIGGNLEINAIAAAVVGGTAMSGGKGSVIGAMIGAIWMGIISNSLNIVGVSTFTQYVVTGCIIIGAVFLNQIKAEK